MSAVKRFGMIGKTRDKGPLFYTPENKTPTESSPTNHGRRGRRFLAASMASTIAQAWPVIASPRFACDPLSYRPANTPIEGCSFQIGRKSAPIKPHLMHRISARLADVLHGYRVVDHGRAFPISANALKSAFNRARHKLGLDHYLVHDIRH